MTSKIEFIENFIKEEIKKGRFTKKLPSEPALMAELGVGRSTLREATRSLVAQNILSKKHCGGLYVVEEEDKGIIYYITDMHSSTHNSFYRSIMSKTCELIENAGFVPDISSGLSYSHRDFANKMDLIRDNPRVKGVITDFYLGSKEAELIKHNIPVVNITNAVPCGDRSIIMEYDGMLALACGIMNMNNHRNFSLMCIDYFKSNNIGDDVEKFKHIMDLAKKVVNYDEKRLIMIPWTISVEEAYYKFKEWWAGVEKPAAIVFIDDSLCSMATRAIGELGIKVPEELAVITIGDLGIKYPSPVEYTRIYDDYNIVAREAVKMILDCVEDPINAKKEQYIKFDILYGKSV